MKKILLFLLLATPVCASPKPAVDATQFVHSLILDPPVLMQIQGQKLTFDSSGNLEVNCITGCSATSGFADNAAFTVGTTVINPIGAYYTSGMAPAITSGHAGRLTMDVNSELLVNCATGCSGSGATFGSAFPSTGNAVGGTNGTNLEPLQLNGSGYLEVLLENSSVAVTGTFWQATQPVSGTFWQATQPVSNAGTFAVQAAQSGTWNITNVSGTVSLPTGAATAAKQPALGTAGTPSADVLSVQGVSSMTALKVDGSGVTQPVSGTITANAGTNLNTSALALDATLTGGTAEANAIPKSSSTYALSVKNIAALTTATTVDASAGNVWAWTVYNPNASLCVLDFYNTTSPTLGTTAPIFSLPMAASATANVSPGPVAFQNFSTAIAVAAETAEGGASTCGTGMIVNVFYK